MTNQTHLTEDERQAFAEGSLPTDRAREVQEHLRQCATCAADVRTLEATMTSIRSAPTPVSRIDELWPEIRSRIERTKVVPLSALASDPPRTPRRRGRWIAASVLIAAAVVAFAVITVPRRQPSAGDRTVASGGASTPIVPVTDSVQSYEAEARVLLNHLEVERAMMRPEAAAMIDRDLKVIDAAIDELKLAIANDPKNAALRQLLAESYRQKVELLKRAENAG